MIEIQLTLDDLKKLQAGEEIVTDDSQDGAVVKVTLLKPKDMATGADIRKFFFDGWDMDYYHEYEDATVQVQDEQGEWLLDDEAMYDLNELGMLEWQGDANANNRAGQMGKPSRLTFRNAFIMWKRNQ
jgi:hypothetical protein